MSFNFAKALLDSNKCPYFWGKITREETKNIFAEKAIGSFLIREVEGVVEDRGLKKFELVKKDKNVFCVFSFDSLDSLDLVWYVYPRWYPISRKWPFSLQELSRSKILETGIAEEGITLLEIPIKLKRQLMGQGSLQHEIPDLIEISDEQPEEEIQKSK